MNTDYKKIMVKAETSLANAKKILWIIGSHAFTVILILILIDVLFAGILIYKYIYLAEKEIPNTVNASFKFKESDYQKILLQWPIRDQKLQEFSQKTYPSPF